MNFIIFFQPLQLKNNYSIERKISKTLEIAEKVLESLRNDPTLSGYVKKFTVGGIDTSKKLFPFIVVEAPEKESESLTLGRDGYMNNIYTMRIIGGSYHMLPDVAHAGNEATGAKGVLQLNSDILNAVIPNDFDGTFARPIKLLSATTAHKAGAGGRSWVTIVTISGRRKTKKQPA